MTPAAPAPALADSPIAHLLVDPQGRIRWRNAAAAVLLGEDGARPGSEPVPALPGDDAPVHVDATDRWVRAARAPQPGGDTLIALVDAQAQVRTARQLAELDELFALTRELGRLGTWWRDVDTMQGQWDPQVRRMWGIESDADTPAFGQAVQRIVAEDRAALEAAFAASLSQPGTYQHRYRVRRPDGSVRRLHSQWVVRCGADGRADRVIGVLMDDTEAWELAQARDERESELVLAEELTGLARWRHDLRTNRMHYSEHAFEVVGLRPRPEGLALEEVRALIHPDDLPRVIASAEQTLRTGRATDFEARYRRSDGQWRDVLTRRALLRDAGGQPVAFLGVSMDVTARVDATRQAQVLTRRLEMAAHSAGIGYWAEGASGERARWSEQMRQLHGLADGEPVPTVREWIDRWVHPLDREMVRGAFVRLRDGERGPLAAEFRIVRPDGGERVVRATSQVDDTGDTPILFGVAVDVTERRQIDLALRRAGERAALAARGAGLGSWERDVRTGATDWDEQMWRLRGRAPRPQAPTVDELLDMVHPDDRAAATRQLAASSSGERVVNNEFRVVWPDGQIRWLASRSGPVRDDAGRVVRRIGVNWDVTDARSAADERRERELAQRASEAKSQFLSRMSHELRTPLNAVLGFTQLQIDRHPRDDATGQAHLRHVLAAGQHLLALINDVLDLAGLEGGRLRMQAEAIDLRALVRESVALVDALRQAQGLPEVELGALDAVPRADRTRLRQVLINLLSNAIKYNRPGGRIRVEAEATRGRVALRVIDGGVGLSPAQLSHLFEPFNRLGAESRGIDGSGIGLAIAKALVERMGGTLAARSQPDAGSTFTVTLPDAPSDPAQATARDDDAGRPGQQARGHVLYIEDNPVNMLLMEEMLTQATGVTLHRAVDGRQGLVMAQALRPDLILLDMQLPDIDGHEVRRRLRADPATAAIPCIAVSANAMPRDIERAREQGFADYWTKPLDLRVLLRAVDRLLAPGAGA